MLASSKLTDGTATVDETFSWENSAIASEVSDSVEYTVVFTPNDADNYTTVSCKVSLPVNKATPTIMDKPNASPIAYGQTLNNSTLSDGVADMESTFKWTVGDSTSSTSNGANKYCNIMSSSQN